MTIKNRKIYKLKKTIGSGADFRLANGTAWVRDLFGNPIWCRVCGHHLPEDQVVKIGEFYVHSDVAICLSLILRSGSKVQTKYPLVSD